MYHGDKLEEVDDLPGAKDDLHQGNEDTMYCRQWHRPSGESASLASALEREIITIAHKTGFPRVTAISGAHAPEHPYDQVCPPYLSELVWDG
jgi:hypothetical protein